MSPWAWVSLVIAVLLGISGGIMTDSIQVGEPRFRTVTAVLGALLVFTTTVYLMTYNDNTARYSCEEVTE